MVAYRIILADDHVIFRQGMKRLIDAEPGLEVVGEASDGHELLQCLQDGEPDMAILDISMPGMGGIGMTREIRRQYPRVKVLILTMHNNSEYLYAAIATGAHGYLLKEDSDIELFKAIKSIRNNKTYITGVRLQMTGDGIRIKEPRSLAIISLISNFQFLNSRKKQLMGHHQTVTLTHSSPSI